MGLFLGLVISSIGLGYFIYGKKMQEPRFLYIGLAMMVYPYFFSNIIVMLAIGIILAVNPFIIGRYFN
ncbi:MAG: hypothetical protein WCF96_04600 [Eubacteriales bacterium]